MDILILTTEPQWKSWDRKTAACRGALGMVKNLSTVRIHVARFSEDTVPTVSGKVDRAWFNKLTIDARKGGYQAVVLHMNEHKADRWGIKQTLRGSTINDEAIGEMYIISDEDSLVRYDSGHTVNRFVKVFIHEMSHWMAKTLGQEDQTHYYDYEKENVLLCMKEYKYPQGLVETIAKAFRRERVTMPIDMTNVTQHFGVADAAYASGIHAGVDIGCKAGTPVLAPTDGRVALVWNNHKELGNACTYEWHYNGKMYTLRLAHLSKVPKAGGYRRGDVIAYTGNTGKSTGPHLHMEVWKTGYDVNMLYKENTVRECLVNPVILFKGITK